MTYEKAEARGGSARRRKAIKELREQWEAAGCPEHFTLRATKNGVRRVIDTAAAKEMLHDLEHPEAKKRRMELGKLTNRLRRKKGLL